MAEQTAPTPLIHARGLTKRFGELTAVDGIDFDVAPGESFGFLGPNGAGKTSTMRMIGCVSPPSGGTLSILGLDPVMEGADIRARLGVVPQQDTLDMELTVRENIIIYGRYFGLPRADLGRRADELIDFVQLNEREEFTQAIAKLQNDPDLRSRLGIENRARVEQFFIDTCAARYEAVFTETIERAGRERTGMVRVTSPN